MFRKCVSNILVSRQFPLHPYYLLIFVFLDFAVSDISNNGWHRKLLFFIIIFGSTVSWIVNSSEVDECVGK